jgi:hypothetical protein
VARVAQKNSVPHSGEEITVRCVSKVEEFELTLGASEPHLGQVCRRGWGRWRWWLRPRVLTGAAGVCSRSNGIRPIVLQTSIRTGEPDIRKAAPLKSLVHSRVLRLLLIAAWCSLLRDLIPPRMEARRQPLHCCGAFCSDFLQRTVKRLGRWSFTLSSWKNFRRAERILPSEPATTRSESWAPT